MKGTGKETMEKLINKMFETFEEAFKCLESNDEDGFEDAFNNFYRWMITNVEDLTDDEIEYFDQVWDDKVNEFSKRMGL